VRVCSGGVLLRPTEILLARRSPQRVFYPEVWDVIGGHCEGGETPEATLVREIQEEIGVHAREFEHIAVLDEPDVAMNGEARYHVFIVTAWDGEPQLRGDEHTELAWISADRVHTLPLAHPAYAALFAAVVSREPHDAHRSGGRRDG
jgi:8-oxo-dGTP diphosphatase